MANREIDNKKQTISEILKVKERIKNVVLVTIVGVVLGFLAPFGMDQISSLLSVSYWVLTCLVGYGIYAPTIAIIESTLSPYVKRQWHRVAIGAFVASALMSFAVPLITWLFFRVDIHLMASFGEVFPKTLLIGGVITIITMVRDHIDQQSLALEESKQALETTQQSTQQLVDQAFQDFMHQLPLDKRGQLLCLEMSDHYLKVYTDQGHHMILMRFKDALSALSNFPGLQTHRSWWVAKDAIVKVEKDGRKLQLVLSNALVVPVSRTYADRVKEAGYSA
ncbi:LytTR family DNA-binding domain-containing protein [Thalassotalea euphylliae]